MWKFTLFWVSLLELQVEIVWSLLILPTKSFLCSDILFPLKAPALERRAGPPATASLWRCRKVVVPNHQFWILIDPVEWDALSCVWTHCTLRCLMWFYGLAAEDWRRPWRPQVVQDHTVRDRGLNRLRFPGWFTLLSFVLVYVLCIQT